VTIEDAIERVNANDLEGALAALVEAWRARRLPALAEVIDELTERLSAGRPPLRWVRIDDAIDTWREHQTSESERGRVLSMLLDKNNRLKDAMIADVLDWQADPRVAMVLVSVAEVAETLWWVPKHASIWKRVFARLVEIGDIRIVPRLQALAERTSTKATEKRIGRLAAECLPRLAAAAATLASSEAETSALARLRRSLAPSRQAAKSAEELLAAVYADPDSDEPRLVYADFLTERGDPRGELIVLQIEGARRPLTVEESRREAALLAPNVRTWLGPLEPAIFGEHHTRYERGFVVACAVEAVPPPLVDHPAWATVRELDGKIDHPMMYRLRRWSGIDVDDVAGICARGVMSALESLEVWLRTETGDPLADLGRFLDETEALPRLRELAIGYSTSTEKVSPSQVVDALLHTRAARGLAVLDWPSDASAIAEWIAALDSAQTSPSLAEVRIDRSPEVRLARGPDGRFSSLSVHYRSRPRGDVFATLRPALEAMPDGVLSRLTVTWAETIRPAKKTSRRCWRW
jgi:uncharacterized protein (TIGR02996 family)